MSERKKVVRSRKWLLTCNNPDKHNWDYEKIESSLTGFSNFLYGCWCTEKGLKEATEHFHLFLHFKSAVTDDRLHKVFERSSWHSDKCRGTTQDNRDYVAKKGKYAESEKAKTSIDGSFREVGEFIEERGQGKRSDLLDIMDMVRDGADNQEIEDSYPTQYFSMRSAINSYRSELQEREYLNTKREDLKVIYIYGSPGVGKSSLVYDFYDFKDIYIVSDYQRPFDMYQGQKTIVFDEYNSDIKITQMNQFLDIYPCQLPARYSNRVACYTTVFILSNRPLKDLYFYVQQDNPMSYIAFLRRISCVVEMQDKDYKIVSALDYFRANISQSDNTVYSFAWWGTLSENYSTSISLAKFDECKKMLKPYLDKKYCKNSGAKAIKKLKEEFPELVKEAFTQLSFSDLKGGDENG